MTPQLAPCRACGAAVELIAEFPPLPALANVFRETEAAARAVRLGPFRLVMCTECTLLANDAFAADLVEYDPEYENSLHFSGAFSAFTDALVDGLIDRYDLAGHEIVEVGCGKGDFLVQLCRTADAHGIGYDPSSPDQSPDPRVRFTRDHFSADLPLGDAALVATRHVLEHLEDPRGFLATIATPLIRSQAALYVEVPDATYMLETVGLWDLIHEHVTYFTGPALQRLAGSVGLETLRQESVFGGQFLALEARARTGPLPAPDDLAERERLWKLGAAFGANATAAIEQWRSRIDTWSAAGERIMLWGAGSKGVTFANLVDPDRRIAAIVDVNPRKWNRYVPGSGHPILGPDDLRDESPTVVVVMNPQYRDEIQADLTNRGITATVEGV